MAFHFEPKTHCQQLRCKEMFASQPRDVEREAEVAALYGTSKATAFWCQTTQTARGPDDQRVDDGRCLAGRRCFVGLDQLS